MAAQDSFESDIQRAESSLSTSFFKWKPDYLSASQHYGSAAKKLRAARAHDRLASVLVQRAECQAQLSNPLGAGIDLEEAAKAMLAGKISQVSGLSPEDVFKRAVHSFVAAAKVERAAAAQLSCLKLACAAGSLARATEATTELLELYADTTKPVYAVDKCKTALSALLRCKFYRTAMQLMLQMIPWFTSLKQPHNVAKMVLSRIILLLADGEVAGARRELNSACSFDGFVSSAECDVAERFVAAVESCDTEAVQAAAKEPSVTALDNQVCRVAQEGLLQPQTARTSAAASSETASLSALLPAVSQGGAQMEADNSPQHTDIGLQAQRDELFAANASAVSSGPSAAVESEEDLL